MNEKVHTLINQQINKEFYSAYLYLNFSNYFVEVGLGRCGVVVHQRPFLFHGQTHLEPYR